MKKILACLVVAGILAALVIVPRAPAASTAPASAAEPTLPDIVVAGFKEFKTGGYTAATNAWARDSSLLQDSQTLLALNTYLSQVCNNAGTFVGADIIRVVNLSANSEVVYATAKFERQLVFLSFTCYKMGDKWLITMIDADKDPAKVLPTNIMSGQ